MKQKAKEYLTKLLRDMRQRWLLMVICSAITAFFYISLRNHYANWQDQVVGSPDLIYKLESKFFDFKQRLRGPQPEKLSGQVGILAIDEKSINRFGTYPIDRKFYGPALKNLKKLGVRYVGFDVIFAEKDQTKLRDVINQIQQAQLLIKQRRRRDQSSALQKLTKLQQWLRMSPSDLLFAGSIRQTNNIILGVFYYGLPQEARSELGSDSKRYFAELDPILRSEITRDQMILPDDSLQLNSFPMIKKAYGMRGNIDLLNEAAYGFAFFNNDADTDAINRWVTLAANFNGHLMPSLALKTVAEHLNSEIYVNFNPMGIESYLLENRDDEEKTIEIMTDPWAQGRILVNHRGPGKTFHHFSLADAYDNTFSEQEKKMLKGMSLLMGGTATGTQDLRPNPYDAAIDGVENHAAVMDNIIQGDFFIRDLKFCLTELEIVLFVGLCFMPFVVWGSSFTSLLAVLLFLAGYWYWDWTFWFNQQKWAYTLMPSLQISLMFFITTVIKYATEEMEKRKVKGTFAQYLSPEVIEQVLDDPSAMALGGKKTDITVFFSDVRSFTTISEGLSPEKLCEFMNLYFNPMTSIVLETGGTLDKYIGDAIMAFWGAPVNNPHHAEAAAEASIKMLFALDKLQADLPKLGFPKPDIGIGLNSGQASVGNMGSDARFTYTAMGDNVNLASRLEGLTKEYGIKILISESTAQSLPQDKFYYRELDFIRVKGKLEPVKVFELMRPDYLRDETQLRNLIMEFTLARQAYLAQDFDLAEKHFHQCLMIHPNDGPTNKYLEEWLPLAKEHATKDWDGVRIFNHK